jgi:hypothetical protein
MLIQKIINEFSMRTRLPVDVNDVVAFFVENGIQDEILFVGVDLDPEVLLGSIKRYRYRKTPYSDPINCANIFYRRQSEMSWQRFITCKELIHLADPEFAKSSDHKSILTLADKIGLPPGMQDAANDGLNTNFDRVAEFVALALLFPWDARNELITPFKAGNITLDEIAILADIPRKYVSFAMHESWERTLDVLRRLGF